MLDIGANRQAKKWTNSELALRIFWSFVQPFFRFSPKPFWGWRCFMLKVFGARIGRNVRISSTAKIMIPWNLAIGNWVSIGDDVTIYNLGLLEIQEKATVSHGAHLCGGTHDYRRPDLPLIKANICIKEGAWVCADAFVGPFVVIGEYSILGARAVLVKNMDPWTIAVGNPARIISERPKFGG